MQQPLELPSIAGLLFQVLVTLAFILLLLYVVLKLLKKQQDLHQVNKGWLVVLDYQPLGQNRGIYLLEVFSKVYVVFAGEKGLEVLLEVEAGDQKVEKIKEQFPSPDRGYRESFERMFDEQLKRVRNLSRKVKKGGGEN